MEHYRIVKRVPDYLAGRNIPSRKLGKAYMVLRPGADEGEWEEFGRRYTVKGIADFVRFSDASLEVCGDVCLDIAFEEWRRNSCKNRNSFKV